MPRRSRRNATTVLSYSEVSRTNNIIRPTRSRPSPQKGRKSVAEEQLAVKEAPKAGMGKIASSQRQKKRGATAENNSTMIAVKSPWKSKITKELEGSRAIISRTGNKKASLVRSKMPGAKRKVEIEEVSETEDKKVKKQKTKESESLPLATRTPIQALKRAMYIGAHVSGAGGKYSI
jgi:AP endonuclease-1